MMSYTPYPEERSRVPGRDSEFTEAINQNMRVPERLSVGVGQRRGREGGEETPPAYSMHIPERLTYADTSDMNPRPLFTPSKPAFFPALGLEPCWESPSAARDGESFYREPLQSPMRRSYSDQGFGKTPPSTPTHLRQGLVLSGHPSSLSMESWSLEDEGGAAVEVIVLRRQLMKMSRRLVSLERQNAERKNTEVALFSLLLSACLLNVWLWIRR
ncbi:mitochondrial fission factor-like isoform X4 [Lampris incognitus]|uniref:mitochondrial fission factor-like isoform X4 n=1 Tax=Lampris incognitus TaxID=2546036 RepID=UPI0024B5DEB4|nr:mitochondrial fission factor-like isoform X4 [Lampris incognitus]